MRRGLVIGGVGAVAAALVVAFVLLPAVSPASTMGLAYHQGLNGSYAYGSCTYSQFSIDKPALITGEFVTNSSATMYVTEGAQSFPGRGGCLGVPNYYYTTGNVRAYSLNFTLAPGTYVIAFAFTNQAVSQTWLNITKGFVATYIPTFVDHGPVCVSIACYQHGQAPQGPNGAS